MTGRELESKLNYYGMEKNLRKLALDEKLATPEEIASMPAVEICELVLKTYECVFSDDETIGLVHRDKLPEYQALVKHITR